VIDREQIKKIRKIEIYTRRLVNDQLAGQYQSVFKGRGMAFEEVRQYQPGDDIRLIDWNVSARMNDIFVKLFVEEREMTVMLLVDMSASTLFGTLSRLVWSGFPREAHQFPQRGLRFTKGGDLHL